MTGSAAWRGGFTCTCGVPLPLRATASAVEFRHGQGEAVLSLTNDEFMGWLLGHDNHLGRWLERVHHYEAEERPVGAGSGGEG